MEKKAEYKRICEHCNKEFMAFTVRTRFCSHNCNRKAYKQKLKEKKKKRNEHELSAAHKGENLNELSGKVYLSVKEACAYLNISRSTLYRLSKMGMIPRIGLGGRTLYKREHLDEFMRSNTSQKDQ